MHREIVVDLFSMGIIITQSAIDVGRRQSPIIIADDLFGCLTILNQGHNGAHRHELVMDHRLTALHTINLHDVGISRIRDVTRLNNQVVPLAYYFTYLVIG